MEHNVSVNTGWEEWEKNEGEGQIIILSIFNTGLCREELLSA
jgi:hypothetical protein